jgi:hypothetical protein
MAVETIRWLMHNGASEEREVIRASCQDVVDNF